MAVEAEAELRITDLEVQVQQDLHLELQTLVLVIDKLYLVMRQVQEVQEALELLHQDPLQVQVHQETVVVLQFLKTQEHRNNGNIYF